MKLSYFMMPVHGLGKDYHQQLLEDMQAIIHADELGYAEAWVGEHHSSGVETITSPLMFLANLIPRTKQIKFATGVICMPQHHPATIAGQAAMFDHLCDGRFILGVGPGGLPPDFELFGTMDADRNEMFVESIDTVLRYWTSDPPYNFEGKYWKSKIEKWTVPELKLGYMAKPLQAASPADCGFRDESVFRLDQAGRAASLATGVGEFHRWLVGQDTLGSLRGRSEGTRPRGPPGDVAGRA